ncbi:hypothetical protein P7K49_029607 [Saguinus oedipus]|uniref:Uncharacterized protein n=1 Tax=Saguinus oedipus TaxID=9490 RepID=A0ABQ9U7Q1_SAGOE|nr:hypothetical protein P7K49_029607 [Saguinus oedipus]
MLTPPLLPFSRASSCSSLSPRGSGCGLLLRLLRAWAFRVSVVGQTAQFRCTFRSGGRRGAVGAAWRLVRRPLEVGCLLEDGVDCRLEVAVAPPGGCSPSRAIPGCVAAASSRGGGRDSTELHLLVRCLCSSAAAAWVTIFPAWPDWVSLQAAHPALAAASPFPWQEEAMERPAGIWRGGATAPPAAVRAAEKDARK